ncbi:MAG: signal peptide peptidase SppA [Chloroflexi bacterium]|nr:signal peptide peptidase SppA [Chloroflexota bacterium]
MKVVWRPVIAVVEISGTIGGAVRTSQYVPLLERLERSRRVRAVVLDIDSPGGSASASDYLHRAVSKIAQKKTVVAFVRSVGASGAYFISCAAHKTVALPTALVGSIGVIHVMPVVEQLLQKVGVSVALNKGGRFKDMGAPWRQPTPEEEQKFQGLVDEYYDCFVRVVSQGRGLDEAKVRELATGEVFTGRRAKELGLVDETGDLDTALEMAAAMAGIRKRVVYVRPRRPFMQRLFGRMGEAMVAAMVEEVESRLAGRVLFIYPS